jgi:hypothetical protein
MRALVYSRKVMTAQREVSRTNNTPAWVRRQSPQCGGIHPFGGICFIQRRSKSLTPTPDDAYLVPSSPECRTSLRTGIFRRPEQESITCDQATGQDT